MADNQTILVHNSGEAAIQLENVIPSVLEFSTFLFNSPPDSKYASIALWTERLSQPNSQLIHLTAEPTGNVVAFLFAHPKTHSVLLDDGQTHSLHIWLAGVDPVWRRGGCLQRMVDSINVTSEKTLTICTIPSRFPDMWRWLQKRGWKVERELEEGKFLLSISASQMLKTRANRKGLATLDFSL
ncbi:hypothetical protein C8Q75DRAFT_786177 [Abortiporus biennis]|nr:hypothetical protein C8Q75DRAFT_786177 [Abortiporus biennis]